jgi:hypothetical protein
MNPTRFMALLLGVIVASAVSAQTGGEFVDQANQFKITLTGDWRPVSHTDSAGRPKTEFVDGDRSIGLLRITRESGGSKSVADLIREEEEALKVYKASYEHDTKEAFGGGPLKGMLLSFYFVEDGRKMAGAYYFLQDKDSVWQLRFIGKRGKLDLNRNIIDRMARSFSPTWSGAGGGLELFVVPALAGPSRKGELHSVLKAVTTNARRSL